LVPDPALKGYFDPAGADLATHEFRTLSDRSQKQPLGAALATEILAPSDTVLILSFGCLVWKNRQ
jgi:hypothetical protein